MTIWTELKQDAVANFRRATPVGLLAGYILSPAIHALVHYRLARRLYFKGNVGRLLSRLLWRRSLRINGCDLGPAATVGPGLCLPHTVGVVVGAGSVIEPGVTIYQGVTLGQKAGEYPTVCHGATIMPGAVVVGRIRIGAGATIGAQSFVALDVADGDVVAGVPARSITSRADRQ